MGLAEDLKALQDLRDKGELSESAYTSARDAAIAKHGRPVTQPKPKPPIIGKFTKAFIAVFILLVGFVIFMNILQNKSQSVNSLLHQPITMTDEVENVRASSWKALNYNLPSGGKLDITVHVVNGNPMDIFLTDVNQLDAMKRGEWRSVKVYSAFNATNTKDYRRTRDIGPGNYYLVLRDTSLGVLSANASDVAVKTTLTP